jgi:replicative DNA helicase
MTNELEDYIIGQLLFYDQTRAMLPRIKSQWFEDNLNKRIVESMLEMYINNDEIDVLTLGKKFSRAEMVTIVKLTQNVYGVPNISSHLPALEHKYLKKQFIENITNLDLTSDLKEILTNVQTMVDNTKFTTINDPVTITQVTNKTVDAIIEAVQRGDKLTGRPTGWAGLDRVLGGWNNGDLIVMAARPGQGKTALALSLMYDFAKIGGKGLFLSLEMSNEQLVKRYLSLITDLANWKIRNANLREFEVQQLINSANNQTVQFYIDDDPNCSIQQIKSKAKIHKAKHGLELLVIDYIQLIKGTKTNREQEIAEISRNLKLLSKELNITVIVLAQLSRKCEERADKRPMLSDIRESGSIEQDADVVMFPFRPAYYSGEKIQHEEAELIIAKNRHGECYTIPTTFIGERTMYEERL